MAFEPLVRRLHIPKAIFFTATNLFDMLPYFDELLKHPARRDRFVRSNLFPEALALWRVVCRAEQVVPAGLSDWEALTVQTPPHLGPEEEEIDESDEAWRAASGAAPRATPRPGFHGGRRRRHPRKEHGHQEPNPTGQAGEKTHPETGG
jgi:hypothetical protein